MAGAFKRWFRSRLDRRLDRRLDNGRLDDRRRHDHGRLDRERDAWNSDPARARVVATALGAAAHLTDVDAIYRARTRIDTATTSAVNGCSRCGGTVRGGGWRYLHRRAGVGASSGDSIGVAPTCGKEHSCAGHCYGCENGSGGDVADNVVPPVISGELHRADMTILRRSRAPE